MRSKDAEVECVAEVTEEQHGMCSTLAAQWNSWSASAYKKEWWWHLPGTPASLFPKPREKKKKYCTLFSVNLTVSL